MTDLVGDGLAKLGQIMKASASRPVFYQRGSTSVTVNAWPGATPFTSIDANGFTVEAQAVDFLMMAADLGLAPIPGDVITMEGRKYQVVNLGAQRCWYWSDRPYCTIYRIHTKEIGGA